MELVHIEDAEKQVTQALQKMAGDTENEKLRQKLEQRLRQGERVLERVRGGLEKLDGKSRRIRRTRRPAASSRRWSVPSAICACPS